MSKARPPASRRTSLPKRLVIVSILAVSVALVCSAVMTARHIWAITLPGCGQLGGCEWAVNGPYSKILGLPVAFVGLAYFAGLLVLLAISAQSLADRRIAWVARTGALASLGFVGLMVMHGQICPWCAFTHVANLIFWGMVERSVRITGKQTATNWSTLAIGTLSGLVVFGLAWSIKLRTIVVKQAEDYRKGMESVARIGTDTVAQATQVDTGQATVLPQSKAGSTPSSNSSRPKAPARFGGRYWDGNPNPSVRIVIFHDYQCELCREVEAAIALLLARRTDVAFSVKQWPFDAGCNRFILGKNMHPGACEASKVAEAAGLAGGDKAFWGMHHWLVERGGQFSQSELRSRLDQLGVDADDFGKAFNDPVVDSMVRADIEEGMAFGLTFTPMVFVNGYKVEGWQSAGVLPAAIERAAEIAKLQPRRNDRPDLALDIQYRNWLATPAVSVSLRPGEQSRGPINAKTTILMYGDLTCAFHASARDILDGFLNSYPDVRYVFRDFPLDANCNELVKQQINPRACEVSRWAMAVGLLAGDSSYWRAYDWIVRSWNHLENVTIENLGVLVGLSPQEILRVAGSPEAEGALQANLSLAIQMGVTMSPTIYVNGKIVTGWRTPGVLDRVVSTAVSGGK